MKQSDLKKLARQFIDKAIKAEHGQSIWIEYQGKKARPLAEACGDYADEHGVHIRMIDRGSDYLNQFLANADDALLVKTAKEELDIMKTMDNYIRICDAEDETHVTIADPVLGKYVKTVKKPYTDYRVRNVRWLVVSAPTTSFAKACGMNKSEFNKFYLDACLFDYDQMRPAAEPLEHMMAAAKDVHIKGRETDLRFSIGGIGAEACTGTHNIPDGECFTAPVKDSINGTILFGPTVYQGKRFESVWLRFEDGRAVEAKADTSKRTEALNAILGSDEGARRVGEFAIAFHPRILHPVGDILFDEKISGSLHMAMGQCYDVADNGNQSSIHWDLVHIQRPEYGGGEIWFDGRLVRKDGLFTVDKLLPLNPRNLSFD